LRNIFTPKTRRIFLINLEGLSIFELHKDCLTHVARFSDEPTGHENFKAYLAENRQLPVTILVDSISEDFIIEKVPHVSPTDRRSFLARKSAQHFRGLDYKSAKIVGRETGGRKDDKVLFSAVGKNQALEPWVKALLQQEIPIRSITTPAYALAALIKAMGLGDQERVLLVNWEVSGIRHTYFERGKTMFSRLTPLPEGSEVDLADTIIEACNQSNDYLERIGLIGFDESMDVHVITPILPDNIFADIPANKNFKRIEHHNSIDMMEPARFSGPESSITAIMLCLDWAIRGHELNNLYASRSVTRFQELFAARRVIYTLSLIFLIAGIANATPIALDALNRRDNIEQLSGQLQPIQVQYDALTAQFPETPIPSEAMELAVGTFELIDRQAETPFALLATLSHVLDQYPTVRLRSLVWHLRDPESTLSVTQMLLDNQAQLTIDVTGVLQSNTSIGESDRQLRSFISALDNVQGLRVNPLSMPVENNPDSGVSTVIDDREVNVDFAIRIIQER
jgi:hypothetical protein